MKVKEILLKGERCLRREPLKVTFAEAEFFRKNGFLKVPDVVLHEFEPV